jgi:hypothetical protein
MVFTGGVPPEVDTVRLLLEQQGLAGRVQLEAAARTTEENAIYQRVDEFGPS